VGPLALLAAAALYGSTPRGLGVNADSVIYYVSAGSLLDGRGFREPAKAMTHYGAGYPLLLASASFPSGDPIAGARLLHALLFGANVLLVGASAWIASGRSPAAAFLAALLFAVSERVWGIHAMAWSEAPFVAFVLGALLLLTAHQSRPRLAALAASALLLGSAAATRYIGLVLFASMPLGLALGDRRPRGRKLRDAAILLLLGSAAPGAWMIRNALEIGGPTDRALALHPPAISEWRILIHSAYGFLGFSDVSGWSEAIQLGFLAAAVALAAHAVRRARRREGREPGPAERIRLHFVLFLAAHLLGFLASDFLFDADIRLDWRALAPLHAFVVVIAVSLARQAASALRAPCVWRAFAVVALFFLCIQADRTIAFASITRRFGRGFTNDDWRRSEAMAYVRSIPESIGIYTEQWLAVRFLTGRDAAPLPRRVNAHSRLPEPRFEEEMAGITAKVERGEAVVLRFGADREAAPADLPVLRRLADATVYGNAAVDGSFTAP